VPQASSTVISQQRAASCLAGKVRRGLAAGRENLGLTASSRHERKPTGLQQGTAMKDWFKRYRKSYDRFELFTDVLFLFVLGLLIAGTF